MSFDGNNSFYQLIYISEPVADLAELFDMIVKAQKFNISKEISGILIIKKHSLFQLIEGSEIEVKKLYEKIQLDKRHKNPATIYEGHTDIRNIPFLGMALTIDFEEADEENIFLFDKKEAIKFSQLIKGSVKEYLLSYLDRK
jgi:hypothetical protein